MTWDEFYYYAVRGFSVGFAIGVFIWLVVKVSSLFTAYFRPPKLD